MVDITIQGGFPKGAILGIGALMALTIAVAGSSRMLGMGHIDMGPTTAVESLNLTFKDLPDGGVLVTNADTGADHRRFPARHHAGARARSRPPAEAGRDRISLDAMGRWTVVYRGSLDAREFRA